jgi:Cu+-exporting ATPase
MGTQVKEHDHECCGGGQGHAQSAAEKKSGAAGAAYYCPMCSGVESEAPGDCPKCGMALEKAASLAAPASGKTIYTCPMHPEIERDTPGDCPKCGMALEPKTVAAAGAEEEGDSAEFVDMRRRFRVSVVLSVPVFVIAMADMLPSRPLRGLAGPHAWNWVMLALSAPVVWWCGWPFLVRGAKSVVTRHLNMFTLIGLGVSVAWLY